MSNTNGTIPNENDTRRKLLEEIYLLKFKLSEAEKSISGLYRELQNIPIAVEEWGYIQPYIEETGKTIKLIKAPIEE